MTGQPPLLDWRNSAHWSGQPLPCRHCGGLTHLRTTKRRPAHKVCAEAALAAQNAQLADRYLNGT